jgi:hypothetical protein
MPPCTQSAIVSISWSVSHFALLKVLHAPLASAGMGGMIRSATATAAAGPHDFAFS